MASIDEPANTLILVEGRMKNLGGLGVWGYGGAGWQGGRRLTDAEMQGAVPFTPRPASPTTDTWEQRLYLRRWAREVGCAGSRRSSRSGCGVAQHCFLAGR